MPKSTDRVDQIAALPPLPLAEASREEVHNVRLRAVTRIAPILALSQLSFGLWFSYAYETFTHAAGLMWLAILFASVLPEFAKYLNSKYIPKAHNFGGNFGIVRAACLGTVWGSFPFLMGPVVGEADVLPIFSTFLIIIAITAVYLFVIPKRGLFFLAPAVMGAAGYAISEWHTLHTVPVTVFVFGSFVFSVALGSIFTRQVAKDSHSQIAIRKRDDIIKLLLAEGNEDGQSEWLLQLDNKGQIQNPSKTFFVDLGLDLENPEDQNLESVFSKLSVDPGVLKALCKKIESCDVFIGFELSLNVSGKPNYWTVAALPIRDLNEDVTGHLVLVSDKTNEMIAEEERSKLALSDPLTGLMNRARFSEEIDKATAKLERYGTNFTLMFLDLDKFKLVNDMRGHMVGDKLLKAVSERILSVVRESDCVARLGGDEFAILMRENCDAGAAARLAARLLQVVGQKYEIDGEFHNIGVSIGIALAPINGTRPNQLLRNADLALYRSKADGRGVFRFFEGQMDADQREKRMLELELREALEQDQFELYYQPIISTATGLAVGMEALIRWNHPIRGRVSPDEFMPIAEQTALIQEIGNWTIHEACSAALEWPNDMRISINLSAQHLIGSDIVKITRAALEETGLAPNRLELEITESLFINNAEEAALLLAELKNLGVDIVLDDFGTGYSSLSYILKFPFDKIKIDRSFVMASSDDSAACAILRMISGLGEQLGIRITAEGVETLEQVEFLQSIKCDEFQGFYFAKPLSKSDLPQFLLRQYMETTEKESEEQRLGT